MPLSVKATFFMPGLDFGEDVIKGVGAVFQGRNCASEDEIIDFARDADAVISPTSIQPFTRRVIESLDRCRIIASVGVGYESIDLPTATEHDICVTNVPDYCLDEVSDHAMALILSCARKISHLNRAIRRGRWTGSREIRREILPPMFRLRGQTLGIVGMGHIARSLLPKARGFGLRTIAYDPFVSAGVMRSLGVERVDLDRLCAESDYISLHAALTEGNKHLIGRAQFRAMKPTAYLVNTSRGGLVDEEALIEALGEGLIAGAGLDVMETEPPSPDSPLLKMDNVVVTGHTAQYSDESEAELWRRPAEEIALALAGKWPRHVVNPQVKEKFFARWEKAPKAPGGG
ncbi:MAG: C-terminal binding protein [Dehalococcoidia bacterium]